MQRTTSVRRTTIWCREARGLLKASRKLLQPPSRLFATTRIYLLFGMDLTVVFRSLNFRTVCSTSCEETRSLWSRSCTQNEIQGHGLDVARERSARRQHLTATGRISPPFASRMGVV